MPVFYSIIGWILAKAYNWKYWLTYRGKIREALKNNLFLAHVPKCAGSSISDALNIDDPGHFYLSKTDFHGERIIFVWRDPIDRLTSVYRYSKKSRHRKISSPLWIMRSYTSFDAFIQSPWFESYFLKLYFFMPSRCYLPANYNDSGVELVVINFDNVESDVRRLLNIDIPKKNSTAREGGSTIGDASIRKILKVYLDDYHLYRELFERNTR